MISRTIAKLNPMAPDFGDNLQEFQRGTLEKKKKKQKKKTTQLRWFGLMNRLTNNRLPTKVFEWMTNGLRNRGRSKLTWTQGISQTMKD
jgi:hypothetical protein